MKTCLLALLPVLATAVHAQPAPPDGDADGNATAALSVGGFATLGAARSNTDAAEFVRYNQAAGATRHATPALDSNAGLQLSYRPDPDTTLLAQAVVHRQANDLYQPELALAFVRRQFGSDVTLRLGRLPANTYLISEYQHIGYAQTMLRPPTEVYSLAPLESIDGADLRFQHSFGTTTLGGQVIVGRGSTEILVVNGGGRTATLRARAAGLAVTLEHGALLLRAGYDWSRERTPDQPPLAGARSALAQAGFPTLAQQLTLADGKRFSVASVGLLYDAERWQVQAEFVRRTGQEPSFLPDAAAWYTMAGYRSGAWLPYYGHARLRQTGNSVTLPATFPTSGALARGVRGGLLAGPEQYSNFIGLRWNQAAGRDFKLQLDRLRPTRKNGTLVNGPASGMASTVSVLSLALDVVF